MYRISRKISWIAAAALFALVGCKGGGEQQANPKPPAEAPPPAQPPQMKMAEPTPEQEQAAQQEGGGEAKPAAEVSPEAKAEADQLWSSLCATCHGATGKGDGPVAAGFPVKPASFDDPEFQKTRDDETIAKVIVQGGASIGKSPLMPGNPQLAGKPEVVEALVQKVRSFGPKQ
jgi:hypothetical protein